VVWLIRFRCVRETAIANPILCVNDAGLSGRPREIDSRAYPKPEPNSRVYREVAPVGADSRSECSIQNYANLQLVGRIRKSLTCVSTLFG